MKSNKIVEDWVSKYGNNPEVDKIVNERVKYMTNKQQTAVDWLGFELNKRYTEIPTELFEEISLLFEQAKQMEKEQMLNELKLIGNYFDVSKLDVKEISHHIRFTSIIQDRINHYNETYGKE